jgi:NAD(P)-dependent dehydrogenase (short-subunit alcohol dehydrogenase family)
VEVDRTFPEFVARVGELHILVNIAGFGVKGPLIKDVNPEDWMRSIEVNVKGSLIMSCKHSPYQSAYAVSKAAAVVLFDILQVENSELRIVNLHPSTPARDDGKLQASIPSAMLNASLFSFTAKQFYGLVSKSGGNVCQGEIFLGQLGCRRDEGAFEGNCG